MTLSYNGTTVTGVTFNGTVCSSVICNGTTVFTSGPTSLAMVGENVFPFTTTGVGTLYTAPAGVTGASDTIFSSTTTLASKIIVKKTRNDPLQVYNFVNGWGTALSGMTTVNCDEMELIPAGDVLFTVNKATLTVDAYAFSSSSGIGTKYANSPTGTDRNSLTCLPNGSGILLWQGTTGVRLRRIAWSSGWSTSTDLQSFENVSGNVAVTSNCDVIFYSSGISGLAYKLNATSLGTKYADPSAGTLSNLTGACFNPARSVFVKTISTNNPQSYQWSYASGFGTLTQINTTPAITAAYTPVFFHTGSYLLMNGINIGFAFNWSGTTVGTALATGGPYNSQAKRLSACGIP